MSKETPRTFKIPTSQGDREILINNTSLYHFEEVHGRSAIHVFMAGDLGARAINHICWAGLLHEDENIRPADVLKIIRSQDHKKISGVIVKAIQEAYQMEGENE